MAKAFYIVKHVLISGTVLCINCAKMHLVAELHPDSLGEVTALSQILLTGFRGHTSRGRKGQQGREGEKIARRGVCSSQFLKAFAVPG